MKTKDIYSSSIAYAAVQDVGVKNTMYDPCRDFKIVICDSEVESIKSKAYSAAIACVDSLSHFNDQLRYEIALIVCHHVVNNYMEEAFAREVKADKAACEFAKVVKAELSKKVPDLANVYAEIAKLKETNSL